jgi:hypothetical protein
MTDGSGSWGSGVEAAAWFRDWLAERHHDAELVTPETVAATLRAGIRELPPAISNDLYHWSFSVIAVIADEFMIQLGACGGLAAVAVSGLRVEPLITPTRAIDELIAQGHVTPVDAERHKFANLLSGPFFGVDGSDQMRWISPVAKADYSLIAIGESSMPRYLSTRGQTQFPSDPIVLRDSVEAFSGRCAPTAIITLP